MDEHDVERKRDAGPRVSRRTFALGAVGACAVIGLGGVKYLPSATSVSYTHLTLPTICSV